MVWFEIRLTNPELYFVLFWQYLYLYVLRHCIFIVLEGVSYSTIISTYRVKICTFCFLKCQFDYLLVLFCKFYARHYYLPFSVAIVSFFFFFFLLKYNLTDNVTIICNVCLHHNNKNIAESKANMLHYFVFLIGKTKLSMQHVWVPVH